MTVFEAVTAVYHLADFQKTYKNVYGNYDIKLFESAVKYFK